MILGPPRFPSRYRSGLGRIVGWLGLAVLGALPLAAIGETLTLTKSGPQAAREGDLVEYRLQLVHQGTVNLDGVQVLDTLPAEVTFVQAVSLPGGLFEPATGVWTLPTLGISAEDNTAELNLQVLVRSDLLAEPDDVAVITNRAELTAPAPPEPVEAETVTNVVCGFCIDWQIVATWIDSDRDLTSDRELLDRYYVYVQVTNNGPVASEGTVTLTSFEVTGANFSPPLVLGPVSPVPIALDVGEIGLLQFGSNWVEPSTSSYTVNYAFEVSDLSLLDPVLPNTVAGSWGDTIGDSGGGQNSSCFIATAAYGSSLDPHVASLRRFRDEILMRTRPGRALVPWYYQVSPPIAEAIARSETLRTLTRLALTPVVLAIENPAGACAVLGGIVFLGLAKARRA